MGCAPGAAYLLAAVLSLAVPWHVADRRQAAGNSATLSKTLLIAEFVMVTGALGLFDPKSVLAPGFKHRHGDRIR